MKKNLILAAVAIMAAGQVANAAGAGREGKPSEGKARDVRESRAEAAKAATGGADAASTQVVAALKAAGLTTNNSMDLADLGRAMSQSPEIMAAARDAATQGKTERLRDLAAARVGGLAFLKDIKTGVAADALANLTPDGKKVQAYATLLLRAGKAAESWDAATVENLTFLLVKANAAIDPARLMVDATAEIARAMDMATTTIAKSKEEGGKSVRLNLEDVNKFCK